MAKPPPPVGTIKDGYRYNGGDPSMKGSWSWVGAGNSQTAAANPSAPGAAYMTDVGVAPKLAAKEQGELAAFRSAAAKAQSQRADANRFSQLNRMKGTGGILAAPFVGGVLSTIDPTIAEMRSISEKLVPAQREAGSGAMSDRDVEMYRAANLSLGKPGNANGAMVRVIDAGARRQSDFSAFMEEWARRRGTLLGAQEAWQAYAESNPLFNTDGKNTTVNKVTPWREWFGLAPGRASAPSVAKAAPVAAGQWKVVR